MENKINVLGVTIGNDTTQEMSCIIERYLENESMSTISIIQIPTLLKALENAEMKEHIEQMDLTVAGDKAILEAAGLSDEQRLRETEDKEFIVRFFRNVVKKEKTVFVLGDTTEEVDKYRHVLGQRYSGVNIAGSFALNGYSGDSDLIVNEINSIAPDVIVSVLDSPFQEAFVIANKNKISAKVWLGLGDDLQFSDSVLKMSWLSKLIDKKILMSKIKKYDNENGE